jgi:hypothetical protein
MLNRNDVANVVRAYLPQAEKEVIDKIVEDVIQDAENIIHSLIRQTIFQERDKQSRNKGKSATDIWV